MNRVESRTSRRIGRQALVAVGMASAVALAFRPATALSDGHIDPSANAHKHSLTIAKHVQTMGITLATAVAGLQNMSKVLQRCDSKVAMDQDVAAAVTVGISGSLGSFGTMSDGLDIVMTTTEENAVLNDNTAYIKVVTAIMSCGGVPSSYAGCAPPGSTMMIASGLGSANTGETIVHEFGHNKGLGHRDSPGNPIMKTNDFGGNEVDQAETAAYHMGGTADGPNRPVDVAFIIDDTGSMTEEIGGVVMALQSHLMTYPPDTCLAFQLTTFKDGVTPREPTTDLGVIGAQVAALTASGGGDCPEASVEAINLAGAKIKTGGRAFVATDASPHAGLDINATIQALRSRGVRVDATLSDDCVAAPTFGPGFLGNVSAVETFSRIAFETGGIFAFVPEVNTSPTGAMRYQNTVFNMVQGGLTQSIALLEPAVLPVGGTALVTVTGASTNFQSSTNFDVLGDGVDVTSVQPLSPIKLLVGLAVQPTAAPGLRDVLAVTPLSPGVTEMANGLGALEIVPAPSTPTILSVQPPAAEAGDSLTVHIQGIQTNFSNLSEPDLGVGVHVVGVTALSATELLAEVEVDPNAAVGFRNVTVTTGGEVADEDITGPFFVAAPSSLGFPVLVGVDPPEGHPGQSLQVTITGQDTSFRQDKSVVSFSGTGILPTETTVLAPTKLTATIDITPDAELGFRDVLVTTGSENAVRLGGFLISVPTCNQGEPLVITAEVLFSQLDGSGVDGDGNADGVLSVDGLEIAGYGGIVIDVPEASFLVNGPVRMSGSGHIKTLNPTPFDVGPRIRIETCDDLEMREFSRIRSSGRFEGGTIEICAEGSIDLSYIAGIEATPENDGSGLHGGSVSFTCGEHFRMRDSFPYVTTHASHGGSISICAFGEEEAIRLEGRLNCSGNGVDGIGGYVGIDARRGGVYLPGVNQVTAVGRAMDGSIDIHAGTEVGPPGAPVVSPSPNVSQGEPNETPCECSDG